MSIKLTDITIKNSKTHRVISSNITDINISIKSEMGNIRDRKVELYLKNSVTKGSLCNYFDNHEMFDIECNFKSIEGKRFFGKIFIHNCMAYQFLAEMENGILVEKISAVALDYSVGDGKPPIEKFVFR